MEMQDRGSFVEKNQVSTLIRPALKAYLRPPFLVWFNDIKY